MVNDLLAMGVQVEMIVLIPITLFETCRFVGPLQAVVPWIKRIWEMEKVLQEDVLLVVEADSYVSVNGF